MGVERTKGIHGLKELHHEDGNFHDVAPNGGCVCDYGYIHRHARADGSDFGNRDGLYSVEVFSLFFAPINTAGTFPFSRGDWPFFVTTRSKKLVFLRKQFCIRITHITRHHCENCQCMCFQFHL